MTADPTTRWDWPLPLFEHEDRELSTRSTRVPPIWVVPKAVADELVKVLQEAHDAIEEACQALIVVEPTLKQPYPDDPRWSPWTRWIDRHEGTAWGRLTTADEVCRTVLARYRAQREEKP